MASPRAALVRARLTGVSSATGRAELEALVASVVAGSPRATLGVECSSPDRPTRDEVWAALADGWGCRRGDDDVVVDATRTLAALGVAAERVAAVCEAGGSVALATGRPASLLGCYQDVARAMERSGATLRRSTAERSAASTRSAGAAIWWLGGVAVVAHAGSVSAVDDQALAADWLFAVGRPDLVVADRVFAAAAVGAGVPTVALADVDALALGIPAGRGAPLVVVPLDCARPPEAYGLVTDLLTAGLPLEAGPLGPDRTPQERGPHSTTPAPGAYAAPESGGEG